MKPVPLKAGIALSLVVTWATMTIFQPAPVEAATLVKLSVAGIERVYRPVPERCDLQGVLAEHLGRPVIAFQFMYLRGPMKDDIVLILDEEPLVSDGYRYTLRTDSTLRFASITRQGGIAGQVRRTGPVAVDSARLAACLPDAWM